MTKHANNDRYTVTSGSEKRRVRLRLGQSQSEVMKTPYLIGIQIDSYEQFLQSNIAPDSRTDTGLQAAFKSVFPITSYSNNARLEFVSYTLGKPLFDVAECK